MTQKLQTLAIKALEDLKKDLLENSENYLFNAWKSITGRRVTSLFSWKDYVIELIDSMIESYKNNSKNIPLRHYYVESNHIRIQVDIHGGLKDASGKVGPFEVYAKILLS
jgi:hypothetical protein